MTTCVDYLETYLLDLKFWLKVPTENTLLIKPDLMNGAECMHRVRRQHMKVNVRALGCPKFVRNRWTKLRDLAITSAPSLAHLPHNHTWKLSARNSTTNHGFLHTIHILSMSLYRCPSTSTATRRRKPNERGRK